jgi:hypothetical protein
MSVIASTDLNNQNDDVLFDKRTLEKLHKLDIEELEYEDPSYNNDNDEELEKAGVVISKKSKKKEDQK